MAIKLEHISKSFEKKVALSNINISFSKGKIYALVGENGAGKSTLVKIISKRILPSKGSINFTENEKVKIVEQRPLIAESISIKENIFLGVKESKKNISRLNNLISQWCPSLELNSIVKNIGGNFRFYTSLLNCLLCDFDVLILDEPAAYLDDAERENLYIQLNKLKEENICVIVITHSKKEIIEYADDVYLLKKGIVEESFFNIQNSNQKEKIIHSIEKSIMNYEKNLYDNSSEKKLTNIKNNFYLQVKNISCRPLDKPLINNISFEIKDGQIIMINGLSESGLLTLEDCISGMNNNLDLGEIIFYKDNKKSVVKKVDPIYLRKTLVKEIGLKIAIVPSNKTLRSSNPELTIFQTIFPFLENIPFSKYESIVNKIILQAKIDASSKDKIKSLSGGMLQRLILERELFLNPDLLILCEPFAGLDIEKMENISQKILNLKQNGKSVLILSSENLLFELCDKIYRLEGGKIL